MVIFRGVFIKNIKIMKKKHLTTVKNHIFRVIFIKLYQQIHENNKFTMK